MRHRQSNGVEISGFIDYEESLRMTILEFEEGATDWYEIFKETKLIRPKKEDLGYAMTMFFLFLKILFKLFIGIIIGVLASQF